MNECACDNAGIPRSDRCVSCPKRRQDRADRITESAMKKLENGGPCGPVTRKLIGAIVLSILEDTK